MPKEIGYLLSQSEQSTWSCVLTRLTKSIIQNYEKSTFALTDYVKVFVDLLESVIYSLSERASSEHKTHYI